MGGLIQMRTPGEMQGDDGLQTWDQAVVVVQGKKNIALYRNAVIALLTLGTDPEFMEFVKGCVILEE